MSEQGAWIKASEVRYRAGRYAHDAGLEEVTLHTLPHTCAKNLVDAEVPIECVARLLGHESVDTARFYTTPNEQGTL